MDPTFARPPYPAGTHRQASSCCLGGWGAGGGGSLPPPCCSGQRVCLRHSSAPWLPEQSHVSLPPPPLVEGTHARHRPSASEAGVCTQEGHVPAAVRKPGACPAPAPSSCLTAAGQPTRPHRGCRVTVWPDGHQGSRNTGFSSIEETVGRVPAPGCADSSQKHSPGLPVTKAYLLDLRDGLQACHTPRGRGGTLGGVSREMPHTHSLGFTTAEQYLLERNCHKHPPEPPFLELLPREHLQVCWSGVSSVYNRSPTELYIFAYFRSCLLKSSFQSA